MPKLSSSQTSAPANSNSAQESLRAETEAPPWVDRAESILRAAPELTDKMRETLWTLFHNAKNPDELARSLSNFVASNETNQKLYAAKMLTHSPDPIERAEEALRRVASLPQSVREAAEQFPKVTGYLVNAALNDSSQK